MRMFNKHYLSKKFGFEECKYKNKTTPSGTHGRQLTETSVLLVSAIHLIKSSALVAKSIDSAQVSKILVMVTKDGDDQG